MAERKAGFSKRGHLKMPKSTQKNTLHSFIVSELAPFDNSSMIRGLIDDVIVNCVEKCEGKKKKAHDCLVRIENWSIRFDFQNREYCKILGQNLSGALCI